VIPPKPSPHGCDGGSDFGSQLRYGLCAPSVLLHVLSSSHIGGESGSGLLCINSLLVELAWPSADVGPHMPEGRRRSGRRRASCSVMNWTASATLPVNTFFTGRHGNIRAPGRCLPTRQRRRIYDWR
jgi:hypothetical protein